MLNRRAAVAGLVVILIAGGCSLTPMNVGEPPPLAQRTTIMASDGSTLARIYRQNRAVAGIDEVPRHVIDAVLAAEDARFFKHPGYDLRSITRAAVRNWQEGRVVQGGSTITQQYVKNTYFRRPPRTFERKARELRIAIELERRYTKREILERYLNTVYLGDGAYGLKAAAETYFRKEISELSLPDGALLAGLIQAPSRLNPRDHPRLALRRRNWVLDRMIDLNMGVPESISQAQTAALGITPEPPRLASRHPYFVEAVKREMLTDPNFGPGPLERARALYKGGLQIETTLDPRLQAAAETAVARVLNQPGDPSAALVAMDPKTGEILAMVGGRDWKASQVNLALGKLGGGSGRQPGSSFKPIVAAAAMEAGITLDTLYSASSLSFTVGDKVWSPGSGSFNGLVTLETAMIHSINSVYARLGLQVGAAQIATQAQLMGVRSKLPRVESLALGAGEVSVLDMASAFATIANGGTAVEPTTIAKVTAPDGIELHPRQERVPAVLSPGNAYLLTKTLEKVIQRGTGVAAQIGRPAAGKTGTSNDYADAWFVGYTPQLVAAVWVGYPDARTPMYNVHGIRVLGGTFPALIWRNFMLEALRGVPPRPFIIDPTAYVTLEIDPITGLLAAPWCPGKPVKLLRELVPRQYCPTPASTSPVTTTVPPTQTQTATPKAEADGKKEPSPSPTPKPKPSPTSAPLPTPTG
jgi:penicillin-binding protein 1A